MKFHMTPGSCSTGIHILLEEVGATFEVWPVNLLAGDQHRPAYLAINPKGTIPTLETGDGTVLTDFVAIAWWLARRYPRRQLLPTDPLGEVRALEHLNYVVGHIHGQGYTRIFTTDRYSLRKEDEAVIQAQGRAMVEQGFALMDRALAGQDYLLGNFGIADAALFYTEFWARRSDIALPENCAAHYQRMLERPSVRQVLREEGYRV